ncbi:hypothetical protein LTR12_009328 [Friedmanniomyces endolithicus]|nr:hypothetical protein LTR74_000376 [Friedmanniomyces endolithicus]KAK1816246.1 hypothetical protein LTR12_009328 [Friedmanniomyces endolithicus]
MYTQMWMRSHGFELSTQSTAAQAKYRDSEARLRFSIGPPKTHINDEVNHLPALAFFAVLAASRPYPAPYGARSPSSCKSGDAPHGVICKKSDHDEKEDESKDFDLWKEMRITGAPDEHDPWVGTGPPHEVKCVEGNCYE